MSYQAVARDSDGAELVDADLFIRISIRSSSVDGPVEWQEEHNVTTNPFGLFQLIVGDGTSTGAGNASSFSAVSWSDSDHFLQVELDPGDGIYELMGITQLLSVPYAFVAARALNTDDEDADPTNELVDALTLNDQVLTLTQGTHTVDLDLSDALSDGDEIVGNESMTLLQLQGTVLNVVESGTPLSVDLAPLSQDDDWVKDNTTVYNLEDRIGVGTANPSSTFHNEGSNSWKVDFHNTDVPFVLNEQHHVLICDVSDINLEVELPPASLARGRTYVIKKIAVSQADGVPITNTLTIAPLNGESIDREAILTLDSFFRQEITLISDGTEWWIIARSSNG